MTTWNLRKYASERFPRFSSWIFSCDLLIAARAVVLTLFDFAVWGKGCDFGSCWPDVIVSVSDLTLLTINWPHAPGGCKELKLTQRRLLQSCAQYTKREVLHAHNFLWVIQFSNIWNLRYVGLLTFHQKSYDIKVQSNFVSAQTAQWDLHFQYSFCSKLQLKESTFFYFWKPGLTHPTLLLMWKKSNDTNPGLSWKLDSEIA